MKHLLTALLVLVCLLTSCASMKEEAQGVVVPGSSAVDAPDAGSHDEITEEPVISGPEFSYGDVVEVSGRSTILPAKMAREQARTQAYTNLGRILKSIVLDKAGSVIGNYSEDVSQLSDRVFANMASIGSDYVSSVSQVEDKNGTSVFTLMFDTSLVPEIYNQAVSAVKKDIDDEKKRLAEVTEQAIIALEEAGQLTEDLKEYAIERLESQIQLLDAAFAGLESDKVMENLRVFNSRIEK